MRVDINSDGDWFSGICAVVVVSDEFPVELQPAKTVVVTPRAESTERRVILYESVWDGFRPLSTNSNVFTPTISILVSHILKIIGGS